MADFEIVLPAQSPKTRPSDVVQMIVAIVLTVAYIYSEVSAAGACVFIQMFVFVKKFIFYFFWTCLIMSSLVRILFIIIKIISPIISKGLCRPRCGHRIGRQSQPVERGARVVSCHCRGPVLHRQARCPIPVSFVFCLFLLFCFCFLVFFFRSHSHLHRAQMASYAQVMTEYLYNKSLNSDDGVRTHLITSAHQQDVKEALIAYFFLWRKQATVKSKKKFNFLFSFSICVLVSYFVCFLFVCLLFVVCLFLFGFFFLNTTADTARAGQGVRALPQRRAEGADGL